MSWLTLLSSLIVSFSLILPAGAKWEIEKRITIPASFGIGTLAWALISMTSISARASFYQVVILEIVLIIIIASLLLFWRFYRDPERIPPEGDNVILSPADGKVIYVKRIERGMVPVSEKNGRRIPLTEILQCDLVSEGGYLIGISMNYLDVHVNRAPIEGKIALVKRIKGRFLSLRQEEAIVLNERVITAIDNGVFKVGIVQIASRMVRRIVSYVKEGDEVGRGDRLGMIRFGSQVDILVPNAPGLQLNTGPGRKVMAGVTAVARFTRQGESILIGNRPMVVGENQWEKFAKENPYWYILAPFEGTTEEFWEAGRREVENIIGSTKPYLKDYGTVTEIGCGVGRCLIPMSSYFEECVGVDISPTMLDLAVKYAELNGLRDRVLFYFPSDTWYSHKANLAYSVKTLYYIEDFSIIEDYIQKLSLCLDSDGVAYLQFDTRPQTVMYQLRERLPDFVLPRKWRQGIRRVRRDRSVLTELFEKYGLSIRKEENMDSPYHVFLLGKC